MWRPLLLPIVVSLAACTPGSSPAWVNDADGSPPGIGDTSDCRAEAKRQADLRYPSQPGPRNPASPGEPVYKQEDPDRFPAEIRFFERCMQRKGFRRV